MPHTLVIATTAMLALSHPTAKPAPDTPFWQDYRESYRLATPVENDVRAIAEDTRGRVWVATAAGVRVLDSGKWSAPQGDVNGPAYALLADADGSVWIGAWNGLYRASDGKIAPAGLTGQTVSVLAAAPGLKDAALLYAGGPYGIWRRDGAGWTALKGRWTGALRAMAVEDDDTLTLATAGGLYRLHVKAGVSDRYSKTDAILSTNVFAARMAPDGRVWVGSSGGIDVYEHGTRARFYTGKQGLPNHTVRGFAFDADGRMWAATELGVPRLTGNTWSLRHAPRWTESNDTRAVVIGKDGVAWVATANGVSAIRRKKMTLREKADLFLQILRKYMVRKPGIIGPAVLKTPGDLSEWYTGDTDNDGTLTAYHCVAESYRYAVTKAPDAQANAREAYHALEFLQTVTGTPGFFARSAVPVGTTGMADPNHTHTPHEIAETHVDDPRYKPVDIRWRKSADGQWLWKGDTSSDEVDGHMFAFGAYFDLAADVAEKKRVAALVDRIVGGIVDAGYYLIDTDGTHTRWAVWAPEKLHDDENWHEERGNNATEILAHLNAAIHITGNPKYIAAKKTLIEKHGYAQDALQTDYTIPSEHTHITDSLLPMAYPNLIGYEKDPALLAVFQASMRNWHRSVNDDKRPCYDLVYNRYSGDAVNLDESIKELRDWPLDLIDWTIDNGGRDDVEFDTTPGADRGRPGAGDGLLTRRLPADERGLTEADGNPFAAVRGNGGRRLHDAHHWLLDYWQARYFGYLGGG
jgi:hypothetical protein